MSQVKITGNASGTGVLTISAPNTDTDRTLDLPDSAGTVATAESTLAQFNASGSAPVYACRAWVDFNGTGTVAIRGSGNVSSITDAGTGRYIMNFTTAMQDANYAIACSTSYVASVTHMVHFVPGGADPNQHLAGSHRGETRRTDNNTNVDLTYIHIMIYR